MQNKTLTPTEWNIARLVAGGFTEKEMAIELFVSVHTIHTHTKNIRRKWEVRNIADITRIYILSEKMPKRNRKKTKNSNYGLK